MSAILRGAALGLVLSSAPAPAPAGWPIVVPLTVQTFPPLRMPPESGRRDGLADVLNDAIRRNDPGIEFQTTPVPLPRALKMAEDGRSLCMNYVIATPERRQFLAFSRSTIVVPLNRLFVRATIADRIATTPDGSADLARAIADGISIALVRGRSYGASIDAALAAAEGRRHLVTESRQILAMAREGRIDMFIGLPHEVTYGQREAGLPPDAFVSHDLPGPRTIEVSNWACVRNAWGAGVLERLDGAHDDAVRDAHYAGLFRWLDTASRQTVRDALAAKGEPDVPDPS